MGCDIHMYVEQKFYSYKDPNGEGVWISIDKWTKNPFYFLFPEDGIPEWEVSLENEMFSDRNYVLFSLLADVRDCFDIKPISLRRGLPNDVSKQIKESSDSEGIDAHSHSWLLVKEIIDFDWNKEFAYNDKNISYRECCKSFIDEFIPNLLKITNAKDLRLVFWFDN